MDIIRPTQDMLPAHHVSATLKVLMLVLALAVVATLGYFVWQVNTMPDTADYSPVLKLKKTTTSKKATTTSTTTKTTAAATPIACGDTKLYGFTMTLGDLWKGYKIKEVKPSEAVIYCYFNMPTTDADYATAGPTNLAGYASVFAVGVYTPAQWAAVLGTPDQGTKLAQTASYVFNYSMAQADPTTFDALRADVKNVIATFKVQ